ncbi:DUF5806 family protein [Haloferacaceae archaeon DSL9]
MPDNPTSDSIDADERAVDGEAAVRRETSAEMPSDAAEDEPDDAAEDEPDDAAEDEPDDAVGDEPSDEGDPSADAGSTEDAASPIEDAIPPDVRKYERFKKMDGAQYDRVNGFLRDRTYITAREWAIARLCADFRTETGVEMTKIGENLPRLIPFMTDTYTPQAVNQARSSFEGKIRKSGATFLYGAMCGFFTAEELDEMMYEVTEIAKFLLEVEGVDLAVEDELDAEEQISSVMREVRQESARLRAEEVECPECGNVHEP